MIEWPDGYDRVTHLTIDSTNREASRQAAETNKPTWIFADEQTAGVGRRGRKWSSPKGNFSSTLLMPIEGNLSTVALHSFVASLALRDSLVHITRDPKRFNLKWPNDVLMDGCKVAGILLETSGVGPSHLNIGIGVNLSTLPESDTIEIGSTPPICLDINIIPLDFLTILANFFATRLTQYQNFGFEVIRMDWLKNAANIGKTITAKMPNAQIIGKFVTVDEQGAVVLQTGDVRRIVHAADIFF
jgi:BirA family biotin operon repressor/biotin-[acetyl-CoA-carboxylase] ligase